jgi:MFS family permease
MKAINSFLLLFYAHRFFSDFVLLYPVYMLLFESKGLSFSEISWLLIIWSIPVILLEIPSGMLADRWSRKAMIVIGTAFKLICFMLWMLADGFILFAAGFVFWGVAEAWCSGATEALLYEKLEEHKQEHQFERCAGKAGFYAGTGLVLSMLLGGAAASVGFDLASGASVAVVAISLLAALLLNETKKRKVQKDSRNCKGAGVKGIMILCQSNKTVGLLLLFCALVVIVPGILEEYDQLYAQRIGLSLEHIGIWGALRIGAESLGRRYAYKLKKIFNSIRRICILAMAGGFLLLVSTYAFSLSLFPAYALFYALISGGHVLIEGMLQRQISSAQRATVLSFSSLLMNLTSIILFLGFAGIAEHMDLRSGFMLMAVYMVLAAAGLMLMRRSSAKTTD